MPGLRTSSRTAATYVSLVALAILAGCGGGGGDAGSPSPSGTAGASIGGTASGVVGSGLVLQLNGGNDLAVPADGSFSFGSTLPAGSAYVVSVLSQPTSPAQTCSIGAGSGTANAAVTDVTVSCSTDPLVLLAAAPLDAASDVPRNVQPALSFSADVDPTMLGAGPVTLTVEGGEVVSATVTATGPTVTIAPAAALWPATAYVVEAAGVAGRLGEPAAPAFSSRFVTADGQWNASRVAELGLVPQLEGESMRLAVAGGGQAVAAWLAVDGSNLMRVWASRRLADGSWEAPLALGTPADGNAAMAEVAMELDGTAHVVWSASPGGGQSHVLTARRGAADADWSNAAQLSLPTLVTNIEPAIAAGAGGAVYVAWVAGDSLPYAIHLSQLQDDGSWSEPTQANEANGLSVLVPAIAVDRHARALLAWPEQDGSGLMRLVARQFRDDIRVPEAVGPAVALSAAAVDLGFSLALNGDGLGVLAWSQLVSGGFQRTLWAALFTEGSGWSAAQQLDGPDTDDFQPSAAIDDEGNALVAWTAIPALVTRADPRVLASRLDRLAAPGTGGWSAPRDLTQGAVGSHPMAALDARGNGLVLWQPSNEGVAASRFTRLGSWQGTESVWRRQGVETLFAPRIGFDATGSAVAAWVEGDFLSNSAGPLMAIGGAGFE
ncbi:MAG: Ig-like domain-containing protein [Piscinibacter sp.]|uniref:Ig-like domain-containing protein n=1 Tax=Piscinibacter sp. TaxID=1903157 RepID=UPI003D127487